MYQFTVSSNLASKSADGDQPKSLNIEYVKDRPGHDRRYAVDWTRINKDLGWSPSADFEVRLEETVNWYKENENWWKPLKEKSELF